MIFYVTKKTSERYGLVIDKGLDEEEIARANSIFVKEKNDLFNWGVKIFYFAGRKSLQIMNFASRATVFLVDVKVKDLEDVPYRLAHYLDLTFEDDPEMFDLLKKYFQETCIVNFDALKDKTIIATMNHVETYFLEDGYRLNDFLEDGYLNSMRLHKLFNLSYLIGKKVNGKKVYIHPGEEFKRLLKERYG